LRKENSSFTEDNSLLNADFGQVHVPKKERRIKRRIIIIIIIIIRNGAKTISPKYRSTIS
jgi:hypothetical protein